MVYLNSSTGRVMNENMLEKDSFFFQKGCHDYILGPTNIKAVTWYLHQPGNLHFILSKAGFMEIKMGNNEAMKSYFHFFIIKCIV